MHDVSERRHAPAAMYETPVHDSESVADSEGGGSEGEKHVVVAFGYVATGLKYVYCGCMEAQPRVRLVAGPRVQPRAVEAIRWALR